MPDLKEKWSYPTATSIRLYAFSYAWKYEDCSENKERLRIQLAQLFHCTRSVIWCVQ